MSGHKIAHLTTVHARYDVRIFEKEASSLARAGYETYLLVRMWWGARNLGAAVYHFHDPELIAVGLLLRLQGAKVIYDSHEDLPRHILSKEWINPRLRRMVASIVERVEDFAARRFSAVVAATPHIARRFARLNPKAIDINNYPLQRELDAPVEPCTS